MTPEDNIQNPEDHQVEPPQLNDLSGTEGMDTEANPVDNLNPPSSAPTPSPTKAAQDVLLEKNNDEVTITGGAYQPPEVSNVLTKTKAKAKAETPLFEKGKDKLELPSYEEFSAEELHAGYLSCLSTSRDLEASLVNTLKRKYEVCPII